MKCKLLRYQLGLFLKMFKLYNKYKNAKVKTNIGTFDSKLELRQFEILQWLEKAQKIKGLQRQVRIKLGHSDKCKVYYIADFIYFDCENKQFVIHDSKGFETPEFKIKLKWLLDCYGGFIFKIAKHNETICYKPFNDDMPLPLAFAKMEITTR